MDINNENMKKEVFESDIPVVVDFYSEKCMPCRILAPVLDELGKTHNNQLKVCRLNVNKHSELADKYGVMAVPTLMYVKNGKEINRTIGLVPKDEILNNLNVQQ